MLIERRAMLYYLFFIVSLGLAPQAKAKAPAKHSAEELQKPVSAIKSAHKAARRSQKKINRLDDQTRRLLEQYRGALKQTEDLKTYNRQMETYIQGQQEEMISIRRQIEEVKDTGRQIEPLIQHKMDSLERFVDLDMPFLLEERKDKLRKLRRALNRSDVSTGEKYRQLLSAFRRERDYGRHLQTWRALRGVKENEKQMVDYVRLGRLVLIYKSLDGREMGMWDQQTGSWRDLPRSYKKDVDKALAIASKRQIPDLLKLPVASPQLDQKKEAK